jgi:hypothetical protein
MLFIINFNIGNKQKINEVCDERMAFINKKKFELKFFLDVFVSWHV